MRTILLADDEENLRILVHATIEDAGFRILEASSGLEALALARKHLPHLLILDWMMPGISGLEVTRAIRSDPGTADIPVILLTARAQRTDREEAVNAGATAYLVKPFSPLELFETMERLLGTHDEHRHS